MIFSQSELPENLEMKIVVKNKFWNPFFAIERTSVFKELKTTIEKELQLLLASSFSKIKVYKNRPEREARQSIELEVVKFSEHLGLTAAQVSFNLSESHYDNDLMIETDFKTLIADYNQYNGPGVFGKTFRFYVKNHYDPVASEIRRILPVNTKMTVKTQEIIEDDEDLVETYRYSDVLSCLL